MAQLDYFGTLDDSWAMLRDIFARGDIRAYWDGGPHERPEARPYTELTEELKQHLRERPRLFLFGSFSSHPPLFDRQQTGPEAGKYFLSDSGGGPLLSFLAAGDGVLKGRHELFMGLLLSQPQYELEPDRWEKPAPALKAAYADIQKRMKKHLIRHQGIWIGPEALKLLEQGKVAPPPALKDTPKQAPRSSASTPPMAPLPRAAGSGR